jgi:hypothetical protein
MQKIWFCAVISFFILTSPSFSKTFADSTRHLSFDSFANGSDGSPSWHPVKGNWQVIDGWYYQQSAEYDCASLLDTMPEGSFEISAEFEQLDGDIGAGFVFSSEKRERTAFAQMVRFDGSGICLLGYYQNGEFNATASVAAPQIALNTRHRLSLRVDRDSNSCSFTLDGKSVLSDVRLRYPSGFIGLQSSGGRIRYRDVSVTSLPTSRKPSLLEWIGQFAVSRNDVLYVPDRQRGTVHVLDPNGQFIRDIGTPSVKGGYCSEPVACALVDDTTLVIADAGSNRIHLVTTSGGWIASTGWKGAGAGEFDEPAAVAIGPGHLIFVLEKENHRVQVFDDSLKLRGEFGSDRLLHPLDLAVEGNTVYVVNTGMSQVECYRWNGKSATWLRFLPYGGGECRAIAAHGAAPLYISLVNEVRSMDTLGHPLFTMNARSAGFMLPAGLALTESGRLLIADRMYGRIIKTTRELTDPEPRITLRDSRTAEISWTSVTDQHSGIIVPNGTNPGTNIPETGKALHPGHQIDLRAPKGGGVVRFKLQPAPLPTIPPDRESVSQTEYSCTFPPGKGMMTYSRLKCAVLLFTNVNDSSLAVPGQPPMPLLPTWETERIRHQIEDGIRFYWIHSGMKFFLDTRFYVIDKPFQRKELYGNQWWYPPNESVLKECLTENNDSISGYSSFLYLTCTRQYDTILHKFVLTGKGGAFTNGVGTGKGYGISWWDVTEENQNAGNNWLMVHEFNHQLDDVFMVSGYPEYWFNHISPTIGTAGPFSEHFDANSYILQIVPREEWTTLRYTSLESAKDQDGDGIPDNAPSLPLDEVRLGSDTMRTDSDNDGVSDFDELRFSNWISEGWGETYNGLFPDSRSKDTDRDGLPDKSDPYPCLPVKTEIPENRGIPDDSNNLTGLLHDTRVEATIASAWSRDSLMFSFKLNRLLPVRIMIDADADGWFRGRGNFAVTVTPHGDSIPVVRVTDLNATDPERWPFNDTSRAFLPAVRASVTGHDSTWTIGLTVGRNDFSGLNYQRSKKIGLSFGFLAPMDSDGHKRYIDIFEPNRLVVMQLR